MMIMTRPTQAALAAAAFTWLVSAGCASVPATPPGPPATPAGNAPEESRQYQIQPGDQLSVKLFYHPTLNEDVTVRPDGRISLQLADEVVAAGLTPRELSEQLKVRYSRVLESPELSVIVKTFAAHRIFVAGEVAEPGEQPLVGRTTALQAIALGGGFKDTARLTQVLIVRRNPDFSAQVMTINLKKVVNGESPTGDVVLMPYDVVYVPRSTIANANKFVKEFIVNMIPLDFGIRVDLVPSN
jgi:protein involved in polysaccharide export with SLBB domain